MQQPLNERIRYLWGMMGNAACLYKQHSQQSLLIDETATSISVISVSHPVYHVSSQESRKQTRWCAQIYSLPVFLLSHLVTVNCRTSLWWISTFDRSYDLRSSLSKMMSLEQKVEYIPSQFLLLCRRHDFASIAFSPRVENKAFYYC